jgi:hypothetical protein
MILPDGRKVEIIAATFGTEHRLVRGPAWLRVVAPLLPETWRPKLGLKVALYKSASPSLFVWVKWSLPNIDLAAATDASLFLPGGPESEPVRVMASLYPHRLETIVGWEFSNFPRRAETIGLRLHDRNAQTTLRVGELGFLNPAPRRYPHFQPDLLPQQQTNASGSFRFLGLTQVDLPPKPAWGTVAGWTEARFEVSADGEHQYRVEGISGMDATGNVFTNLVPFLRWNDDPLRPCFNSVLWPGERAYRIVAEFVATNGFDADELHTTDSIPLPAQGSTAQLRSQVSMGGSSLSLETLQRHFVDGMLAYGHSRDRVHLRAALVPPVAGLHLDLVAATDGGHLPLRHEVYYKRANGQHEFLVHLRPGSQSIRFTLAVHKSVAVGFVAPPPAKLPDSTASKPN